MSLPIVDRTSRPRIVPDSYVLLANWRYLEHSLLRILAGWGRCAADWEDKGALCHHVWMQAEIVDRMRKRLTMFPGGKPDAPCHAIFEHLTNTILLAPSFADAMAGVHSILNPQLLHVYHAYLHHSHPIHDLPTHELLREAISLKCRQADWYATFRQRHPHHIDPAYDQRIRQALANAGNLTTPIDAAEPHARPCGRDTAFRMPITPGRPRGWNASPDIMPFLEADWSTSVEARRLYFMIGYMREMGVAEDQLRWIYHADCMPWEYTCAEARHMWDESRHGDSGRARLRDFGLDIEHVGYDSYGKHGDGTLPPMTPDDLCRSFYYITQVAETGYFATKRYCFEDFALAGDDSSAEMMQYDIIDETTHVEYGHHWLPELMRCAGWQNVDYRALGAADRRQCQHAASLRAQTYRDFLRTGHSPDTAPAPTAKALRTLADPSAQQHYQHLLQLIHDQLPMRHLDSLLTRPPLPM